MQRPGTNPGNSATRPVNAGSSESPDKLTSPTGICTARLRPKDNNAASLKDPDVLKESAGLLRARVRRCRLERLGYHPSSLSVLPPGTGPRLSIITTYTTTCLAKELLFLYTILACLSQIRMGLAKRSAGRGSSRLIAGNSAHAPVLRGKQWLFAAPVLNT